MKQKQKQSGFTGQLGFVLAAAGSAVGVGNIWRFPYLAAKDGGGLFVLIYLCLVLTVGYTLLTSDIAIGRKTGKSSIYAYQTMHARWKGLGILTFFVPVLIMTYYAVIGGWISRYVVFYLTGNGAAAAESSCFTDFICNPAESVGYALAFMLITAVVVFRGVEKGIEQVSRIIMPLLLLMIVFVSIYALQLQHTDALGVKRTGLEGLWVYLKPDWTGMTGKRFCQILLDAMSQLFFSLSVSMGIMITYGSYVKKEVDLNRSVAQIEVFDTGVALLAGVMIIPAVFVFFGLDGMQYGPSLMFVALPRVFQAMGRFGTIIGLIFFLMAAFAALTSCISVLESITANCMELFHTERKKTTLVLGILYCGASAVISLGYSWFYLEIPLPNGSVGQLLDLMDYISNSCAMPLISFLSAILIGWIVKPSWIIEEVEHGGRRMKRKKIYCVIIRYFMPVIMFLLFLQSVGVFEWFAK